MPRTVASGVTYYERTDMGWPATVYNSDGSTPRPKLAAPAKYMTVHYTGANVNYEDKGDFVKECQDLERYAVGAGKSNEYNWIVGADGPDAACIACYAGDYRAAHSEGENDLAIGILFMNGVGQRVTDSQVLAFQWLVADLKSRARTGASTAMTPHKSMPGAATICPNEQVMARWNELCTPYSGGGGTPVPPPNNSDEAKFKQWVRDVLNEGTGAGLLSWAQTIPQILATVQQTLNVANGNNAGINTILGKLKEIEELLVEPDPDG